MDPDTSWNLDYSKGGFNQISDVTGELLNPDGGSKLEIKFSTHNKYDVPPDLSLVLVILC